MHETSGIPVSPVILKVGDCNFTGEDARNFFNPPAKVEIDLSRFSPTRKSGSFTSTSVIRNTAVSVLTSTLSVGETITMEPSFVFKRRPMRIFTTLSPVLLAPFRLSRAVDGVQTVQNLSGEERGLMLTELARIDAASPQGVWLFADRLAEGFGAFPNAKVKQIRDGRNWAVRIDVATNQSIATRSTPRRESVLCDLNRGMSSSAGRYSPALVGGSIREPRE